MVLIEFIRVFGEMLKLGKLFVEFLRLYLFYLLLLDYLVLNFKVFVLCFFEKRDEFKLVVR